MFLMGALAMTLFVGLSSNSKSLSSRVEESYRLGNYPSYFALTSSNDNNDDLKIKSFLNEEEGEYFEKRLFLPIKLSGREAYLGVVPSSFSLSTPTYLSNKDNLPSFFYIDKSYQHNSFGLSIEVGKDVTFSLPLSNVSSFDAKTISILDKYVKEGKENLLGKESLDLKQKVTSFMEHPENISKSAYNPSLLLMDENSFKTLILDLIRDNYVEEFYQKSLTYVDTLLRPNEYLFNLSKERAIEVKEEVESYFAYKEEYLGISSLSLSFLGKDNPLSSGINVELTQAKQLTYLFPALFFLVSILIMLTTLSQMIEKERLQIGTFKALGFTNFEICRHYCFITLSVLLLSSLAGFIFGPLILPTIMGQKYDILYTLPTRNVFVFPALPALISFLIFVLSGFLVAYYSCYKTLKEKPATCLRPSIKKELKESKMTFASSKPIFLSFKMALRNIRSNIFKSVMVVVGVAGCTTLLLCGYGIDDTIDKGINTDININYSSTFTTSFNQRNDPLDLTDVASVNDYDSSYLSSSTLSTSKYSEVYYVRLFDDYHPYFKVDLPKEGVAISKKISKVLHINIGDMVEFDLYGKKLNSKVSSIYDSFSINGIAATFSSLNVEPLYNFGHINSNSSDIDGTMKEILSKHEEIKSLTKSEATKENILSIVSGIKLMTGAVKYFAIALALVVLYNLSLMNFSLKRRDIATLRVLGFSSLEIGETLMFESLLLSLVGFGLGCLCGFPFMSAVLKVNEVNLVEFLKTIDPISYLWSFILTFVVFAITNLLLSLKTKKIKMVESLKAVE